MAIDDEARYVTQRPGRPWYLWDILLFGGFAFVYAALFGVLHVVAYILGLQRAPSLLFAVVLAALASLTLLLLCVLAVRMARTWPRRVPNRRRLASVLLLSIIGVVVYLALPFTRFGFPRHKTFAAGFRQFMLASVDLDSLRAWLNTVDPNSCTGYEYELHSGAPIESWWPEAAPWARTITPLHPDFAALSLDEAGHPRIRLIWNGFFTDWGFAASGDKMQTPPAGCYVPGEYRLPVAPGVYVWHEVH